MTMNSRRDFLKSTAITGLGVGFGGLSPLAMARSLAAQGNDVLPPGILPVVIISGSDYEMGFQYGQQAGAHIFFNARASWASALQRFTHDGVRNALKANQHFIQEYTPENIEIMKGMAAGATAAGFDLSYEDALMMNCVLPNPENSNYPAGAEASELPPERLPRKSCSVCSAWGSATKDGRLIGLDTVDGGGEAFRAVIIVAYPDEGHDYMCGAVAGEIGEHFYINNTGLFIGNSGGGASPRAEDSDYGLCWANVLPHIVRFADNAVEARDMMLGFPINFPENFHFVDQQGNAFVVEKTAAIQAVRSSGDFGEVDFLYSTNTYLHESMGVTKFGEFVKEHGGYDPYSSPRNMLFWDMLHNYHGQVDEEFMKMILRFPGNPPPYPPPGGWDAKICRPSNGWVSVVVPHNGDEGMANVCTGPAGRVIHSSMASSGEEMRTNYQYIEGTHTFYRLRLAADPKSVVDQAKDDARSDIATAFRELMQLNFTDTGYAALDDLYSQANAEYYQGNVDLDRALLASGNEALRLFAEAATAYTRSQAHARQVYEALAPQPTSPSDLGLRGFGGDWATWETTVR
jgi:hypothetical protein